jgi:hypothetical protein
MSNSPPNSVHPGPLLIARPDPSLLSLVLPIYNEEEVIPLLRRKLEEFVTTLPCAAEIILVNDGSSDDSLRALLKWAHESEIVSVLSLSRNFGHQAAATAGLDQARGDAVVLWMRICRIPRNWCTRCWMGIAPVMTWCTRSGSPASASRGSSDSLLGLSIA